MASKTWLQALEITGQKRRTLEAGISGFQCPYYVGGSNWGPGLCPGAAAIGVRGPAPEKSGRKTRKTIVYFYFWDILNMDGTLNRKPAKARDTITPPRRQSIIKRIGGIF